MLKLLFKKLKNKTKVLIENPRLGRIVPEFNEESIREIIFGNFRIIYRIISEERTDILTIYHSARLLRSYIL